MPNKFLDAHQNINKESQVTLPELGSLAQKSKPGQFIQHDGDRGRGRSGELDQCSFCHSETPEPKSVIEMIWYDYPPRAVSHHPLPKYQASASARKTGLVLSKFIILEKETRHSGS